MRSADDVAKSSWSHHRCGNSGGHAPRPPELGTLPPVASLPALATVRAFAPGALVLALGLDAHENDPLKGMQVTTAGFERIGNAIAGLDLPTVIVQEGGYLSEDLTQNLTAFMIGYQSVRA